MPFSDIDFSTLYYLCLRKDEVRQQLRLCHALWPPAEEEPIDTIERIEEIFQRKYRRYLNVFRLGQDTSLTNTIFRAVFDSKNNNHTSLNQLS